MDASAMLAMQGFAIDVQKILSGGLKAMYAYGSAVYDDLHIGYSDLDFFAVVSCDITEERFESLLEYRKKLRVDENRLLGMLEGEFVPEHILPARSGGCVAYWGTSGEQMKDRYDLAGFSLRSLMDDGVLVFGTDVRSAIPYSTVEEMLGQIENLIQTVRKHAAVTTEDIHSADWLFLVCQSLFWLKTGGIACKTRAAEWVKDTYSPAWQQDLNKAIHIRLNPQDSKKAEIRQWLIGLSTAIQAACDLLEQQCINYFHVNEVDENKLNDIGAIGELVFSFWAGYN